MDAGRGGGSLLFSKKTSWSPATVIDPNDKFRRGPVELSATSTTLLRGLREDESAAWERLASKYPLAVYRWARRAGLAAEDARDVAQEVLRSAARNFARFRKERPEDTFRGWLRRITQRRIADRFREMSRQPGRVVGGSDHLGRLLQAASPEERISSFGSGHPQALVREALAAVRGRCKERNWQMFSQVVFEDALPEEVAEAFGVPCSHVYNIKSRYLARLREELARRGFTGRTAK